MGGHGGLNILPQKRWNVYNFDNREKVRRDEEAAAKEEQLQREQAAKRDAEFRLEKLRQARGLSKTSTSEPKPVAQPEPEPDQPREADSRHMNLFEGIRIFDPVVERKDENKEKKNNINKRVKKEEPVRVVTAEDEKYRLGYGVAGKGVKLPWYMSKPGSNSADEKNGTDDDDYYHGELEFGKRKNKHGSDDSGNKKKQKKSLEELREERLERERKERERERALKGGKSITRREGAYSGYGYGHSSRR